MKKITESDSLYENLENLSTLALLKGINAEDKKVAAAVEALLPKIEALVDMIVKRMKNSGRLFYIGSGTSGRLGVLDASECPPTFGVSAELVTGIIAGGDAAIRKAQEFAEDDQDQAWKDLLENGASPKDSVIGIAASGTTPYVIGGLERAKENGLLTACITCNPGSPVAEIAEYPLVAVVGPEFVTGSTRMKSGTAQKLLLNMISTTCMIKLGRVKGSKMVDMQLSNEKLVDRGIRMIMEQSKLSYEEAKAQLLEMGSVRSVLEKN